MLTAATRAAGQTRPAAAARPAVPMISSAVMDAIRTFVDDGRSGVPSLSNYRDGSTELIITSNRAFIAWKLSEAREGGGVYTPHAELRTDLVTIECGDKELARMAHCTRVSVFRPDGSRVPPRAYASGLRSYRNALGARWSVHRVFASYPAAPLAQGFSIKYADGAGSTWTHEVSAGTSCC